MIPCISIDNIGKFISEWNFFPSTNSEVIFETLILQSLQSSF